MMGNLPLTIIALCYFWAVIDAAFEGKWALAALCLCYGASMFALMALDD